MEAERRAISSTEVDVRQVAGLLVRTRLTSNWTPAPGFERVELDWVDVLDAEPPTVNDRNTGAYTVPLRTEVGPDYRIDVSTRAEVRGGGSVVVEDVLSVRPRLLLGYLQRHREREEERRRRWLGRVGHRAAARLLYGAEIGGVRGTVHRALGRFERRHGALLVAWSVALLQWLVELPDRVVERFLAAWRYLGHGIGRKELRRGLKEPRVLSVEGKSVLLLLLTVALVGGIWLLHTGVTLVAPSVAGEWRAQLGLFTTGVLTALFLPTPFEPVVVPFVEAGLLVGLLAFAIAVASRVVGGYLVFFVGEEVNEKMEALGERWPVVGRAVKAIERFAQKYGFWAVVLLMAPPLAPDNLVLYVFGTARMPMKTFLYGVALGTALRVAIFLGLVYAGDITAWAAGLGAS